MRTGHYDSLQSSVDFLSFIHNQWTVGKKTQAQQQQDRPASYRGGRTVIEVGACLCGAVRQGGGNSSGLPTPSPAPGAGKEEHNSGFISIATE